MDSYDDSVRFEIGSRIRSVREDAGITMAALAYEVGYADAKPISKIELGTVCCTLPILYNIGKSLGVSVDYLLYGEEKSLMMWKVDECLKQMDDKGLKFCLDMIEAARTYWATDQGG